MAAWQQESRARGGAYLSSSAEPSSDEGTVSPLAEQTYKECCLGGSLLMIADRGGRGDAKSRSGRTFMMYWYLRCGYVPPGSSMFGDAFANEAVLCDGPGCTAPAGWAPRKKFPGAETLRTP